MIDAVGGTGGGATPPLPPSSGTKGSGGGAPPLPPSPDISERGANRQVSDRRLFMQLQAFGGCAEPKALQAAPERSQLEALLYAALHDPRGAGALTFAADPAFFGAPPRAVRRAE